MYKLHGVISESNEEGMLYKCFIFLLIKDRTNTQLKTGVLSKLIISNILQFKGQSSWPMMDYDVSQPGERNTHPSSAKGCMQLSYFTFMTHLSITSYVASIV